MKCRSPCQQFVHAESIALHDNPDFRDFVAFLRAELDRVGAAEEKTSKDFSWAVVKRAFFERPTRARADRWTSSTG